MAMSDTGQPPPVHSGPSLGVIQAMLDIGMVHEADARVRRTERVREEDGFLPGTPDHYQRLAEAVIDLINAHPVQGPEALATMLHGIERSAWQRQDRLYEITEAKRQQLAAWKK